jgi:hypothetical protein
MILSEFLINSAQYAPDAVHNSIDWSNHPYKSMINLSVCRFVVVDCMCVHSFFEISRQNRLCFLEKRMRNGRKSTNRRLTIACIFIFWDKQLMYGLIQTMKMHFLLGEFTMDLSRSESNNWFWLGESRMDRLAIGWIFVVWSVNSRRREGAWGRG